jgi:nucleoid-associated protein YgaU
MSLLDQVLGSVLGGDGGSDGAATPAHASGLAEAVMSMLNDPRTGGLDGLVRQFQQSGLADVVASWVGTGQNQGISPGDLTRTLGADRVGQLARQANLSDGQGSSILAASELSRRAGGVTVMADKKADFSDVQSGSSSTAPSPPAPKPTPDRTYTVVAGDSLSKIAKKLLGNANRWHEIHELNKDTIKNPDLIRPGQVLKIPAT